MHPIQLAPNVHWLPLVPPYAINAYLIDDVLIDAGTRYHAPFLIHLLRRQRITAHVLTHAHPDHQGASHAVCTALGLPLWCGARDVTTMEHGSTAELLPPSLSNRLLDRLIRGPNHQVTRSLHEGDLVGSFEVIDTPGHTPGHIALWRDRDRTLILGDVLAHCHPITNHIELREPLPRFTPDPPLNRSSARKLAPLRPRLVCFGHGPPLRDADQFHDYIDSLPS